MEARAIQLLDQTEFRKLQRQFETELSSETKAEARQLQARQKSAVDLPSTVFTRNGYDGIIAKDRSAVLADVFGTTQDEEKESGPVVNMTRGERSKLSSQGPVTDLKTALRAVRKERAQESFQSVVAPNAIIRPDDVKQAVDLQAAAVDVFRHFIDITSKTSPLIPTTSNNTEAREIQMSVLFDTKEDLKQTPDVDVFGKGAFDLKASEAVASVADASVLAHGPLETTNQNSSGSSCPPHLLP